MFMPHSFQMFGGGGISSLADLFDGDDGFAFEFHDQSTLWQDTSGSTAVTADGDAIARADDTTGNGYNALQGAGSDRPTFKDSGGVKWANFNGDFLTIPGSMSSLKWLHQDSGIGIAVLASFGNSSNPNTRYALFGNNGASSSNIGISSQWDDRSGIPINEALRFRVTNGSGTPIYFPVSSNGVAPPETDLNIVFNVPSGGDADIYVDNSVVASDTKTGSDSVANATYSLDIGAFGGSTGSGALVGRIYAICMRDRAFTELEIQIIDSYFNSIK